MPAGGGGEDGELGLHVTPVVEAGQRVGADELLQFGHPPPGHVVAPFGHQRREDPGQHVDVVERGEQPAVGPQIDGGHHGIGCAPGAHEHDGDVPAALDVLPPPEEIGHLDAGPPDIDDRHVDREAAGQRQGVGRAGPFDHFEAVLQQRPGDPPA